MQKADGMIGRWTTSSRHTVFDGTITTAVQFEKYRLCYAARGTKMSTAYAEQSKDYLKCRAAEHAGYVWMHAGRPHLGWRPRRAGWTTATDCS